MNINTTYLLTGAAGFLGINICTQLIERGEHIRAFVLKGDPARKYLPAEVEVFEGDLCSAEDCEAFFNIPEGSQSVCIHCASMVTIDPEYSEKLIAVNVGGTDVHALVQRFGAHDRQHDSLVSVDPIDLIPWFQGFPSVIGAVATGFRQLDGITDGLPFGTALVQKSLVIFTVGVHRRLLLRRQAAIAILPLVQQGITSLCAHQRFLLFDVPH